MAQATIRMYHHQLRCGLLTSLWHTRTSAATSPAAVRMMVILDEGMCVLFGCYCNMARHDFGGFCLKDCETQHNAAIVDNIGPPDCANSTCEDRASRGSFHSASKSAPLCSLDGSGETVIQLQAPAQRQPQAIASKMSHSN